MVKNWHNTSSKSFPRVETLKTFSYYALLQLFTCFAKTVVSSPGQTSALSSYPYKFIGTIVKNNFEIKVNQKSFLSQKTIFPSNLWHLLHPSLFLLTHVREYLGFTNVSRLDLLLLIIFINGIFLINENSDVCNFSDCNLFL